MTVIAELPGAVSDDGFLVAPVGARVFPVALALRSDAGPVTVTLRADPDGAGLVFAQTEAALTAEPTLLDVHATRKSITRADTAIEVLDGDTVVSRIGVTAIAGPVVHFRGRFQARFATQPSVYNANPAYTATSEDVGPGWTW